MTTAADRPVLSIEGLDVTFAIDSGDVHAVKDLTLEVRRGEVLAIVGESGSGKSVTAKSVLGLLPDTAVTQGAVVLQGRDVLTATKSQLRTLRGADVSMVFQEPSTALNPVFTIGWQIAEGLKAHNPKLSKKEIRGRVVQALEDVGIPHAKDRYDYYPHQFSGGQKQRIVIAMALALGADVIVADEPTTALDVTVQAEILDLLRHLRDERGTAIVLITHNMGVVADLADRVAVMYRGDLVETAPVKDLFANPQDAYTQALLAAVPRLGADSRSAAPATTEAPSDPEAAAESEDAPGSEDAAGSATAPATTQPRTPGAGEDQPAAASAAGSAEAEALVIADGLEIVYPGGLGKPDFTAVSGVDFTVRRGEVFGLVGESGSGKTTIGRAIAGLTTATGGSLTVLGHQMVGMREKAFKPLRKRIGFVFQDPAASFNPQMTIGQCIAEPFAVHRPTMREADRRAQVRQLLDAVQLPGEYADRYPHELSGGQRQRASLARGIALDPELLIADEPTSALDVSVQAKVLELFRELQARLGFAAVFISHDLAVVDMLSDQIGVLYHGELLENGSGDQVLTRPQHDYTRRLIASLPVPDPVAQAERRAEAARLRAAL